MLSEGAWDSHVDANDMLSVCKMARACLAFKFMLLWFAGKGQEPSQELLQAFRHHRKPHLEVKETYSFCGWFEGHAK